MWSRAPQSMAFGPTSLSSLLELQGFSSTLEPESESLGVVPRNLFWQALQGIFLHAAIQKTLVKIAWSGGWGESV